MQHLSLSHLDKKYVWIKKIWPTFFENKFLLVQNYLITSNIFASQFLNHNLFGRTKNIWPQNVYNQNFLDGNLFWAHDYLYQKNFRLKIYFKPKEFSDFLFSSSKLLDPFFSTHFLWTQKVVNRNFIGHLNFLDHELFWHKILGFKFFWTQCHLGTQ